MEYTEFSAKTTHEALEMAKAKFGLPIDKLDVQVINAGGGGGLFGLFKAKKAVIRVRPIDEDQHDPIAEMMADFTGAEKPGPKPAPKPAPKPEPAQAVKVEPPVKAEAPREPAPRPLAAAPAAPAPRPAPPVPKDEEPPAAAAGPDDAEDLDDDDDADDNGGQPRELEEQAVVDDAREVLERLVRPLDEEASISAENTAQGIMLDIQGQEAGVLIGRRGQTLDALQYLATRIVSHKHGRPVRVHVDAGGYRRRRLQSLEELALRLADKARSTGRPVSLGPICAQERRVVHMTLRREQGITTVSRGRGEMKKVVISPRR